jgi:hypothetical protein
VISLGEQIPDEQMPSLSNKVMNLLLMFDLTCLAFFGRGEDGPVRGLLIGF